MVTAVELPSAEARSPTVVVLIRGVLVQTQDAIALALAVDVPTPAADALIPAVDAPTLAADARTLVAVVPTPAVDARVLVAVGYVDLVRSCDAFATLSMAAPDAPETSIGTIGTHNHPEHVIRATPTATTPAATTPAATMAAATMVATLGESMVERTEVEPRWPGVSRMTSIQRCV